MSAAMALTATQLHKSFQGVKAVAGVSLKIPYGRCLALLGPNGAGKSTMVEMLAGLLSPDEGRIEIFGLAMPKARRAALQHMGVQLQETTLYKRNTVRETLELFASFYAEPLPINSLLERLDLLRLADKQLKNLSGGERQRCYLACALINNPKLLFLDEPTTGLDPSARRQLWQFITELKSEGRAILLTTHYMEEATYLADHVSVMDRGLVIADGTPDQLIKIHGGDHSLQFEVDSTARSLWQSLKTSQSWLTLSQWQDGRVTVPVNNLAVALQDLARLALSNNLEIKALSTRQATLEDVFLRLTGRAIEDGQPDV